jgi:anti-anti-sigma regulatory factor
MTSLLPRPPVSVEIDITKSGHAGGKIPLGGAARPFSAALSTGGSRWILDLRGHLQAHSVVALDVQAEQIAGTPPTSVVFRLDRLRTIDEVGARCLMRLQDTLEVRGSSVAITGARPAVRTVIAAVARERNVTT